MEQKVKSFIFVIYVFFIIINVIQGVESNSSTQTSEIIREIINSPDAR